MMVTGAAATCSNRAGLKMIGNGSKSASAPPTPNTLAKLEDPRAWHARGEVGIVRHTKSSASNIADSLTAMPMAPPLQKGHPIPVQKKVLDEEEYVEQLGDIIENDYFPHNAKMSRALAGLGGAAVGVGTGGGFLGTPSSSALPSPGRSTPGGGRREGAGGGHAGKAEGKITRTAGGGGALTRFVATHTSEDNQAFAEIQDRDQEAFRRRYFWAYDNIKEGEGNNATATKLLILPNGKVMSIERRELMDAACADRPKIGDHRPNQVDTWKHRTRNQLMFLPTMAGSNDTCRIEQAPEAAAPLLLEGASSTVKTSCKQRLIKQRSNDASLESNTMDNETILPSSANETSPERLPPPSPDDATSQASIPAAGDDSRTETFVGKPVLGTESSDPAAGSRLPEEQSEPKIQTAGVNAPAVAAAPRSGIVLKTNPKVIQAHATRFPVPKARPRRAGVWASPIESPSSSRESVKELQADGAGGNAEEYSEVPMTPSRLPGIDGDSPQITWGSIDGTPMILDPRMTPLPDGSMPGTMSAVDIASVAAALGTAGGSGGRHFEVKDLPARDKLAHRLEADDTRRKRARPGGSSSADNDRGSALRTPGSLRTSVSSRTPGTGRRADGAATPGTARRRESSMRGGVSASPASVTLTPAGRTLAAKLASRRGVDTPFGGALSPGPQKRRHRSTRNGGTREGLTPLPGSTPVARASAGLATPVGGIAGRSRGDGAGQEKGQSSLTDGLLSLK